MAFLECLLGNDVMGYPYHFFSHSGASKYDACLEKGICFSFVHIADTNLKAVSTQL